MARHWWFWTPLSHGLALILLRQVTFQRAQNTMKVWGQYACEELALLTDTKFP